MDYFGAVEGATCEGVTCDDYCNSGTSTRYHDGTCSAGICSYSSESCSLGCASGSNLCATPTPPIVCSPGDHLDCYGGQPYWYDSCGNVTSDRGPSWPCIGRQVCVQGECQGAECYAASDCDSTQDCVSGDCVEKPITHKKCWAYGEVCINNKISGSLTGVPYCNHFSACECPDSNYPSSCGTYGEGEKARLWDKGCDHIPREITCHVEFD